MSDYIITMINFAFVGSILGAAAGVFLSLGSYPASNNTKVIIICAVIGAILAAINVKA